MAPKGQGCKVLYRCAPLRSGPKVPKHTSDLAGGHDHVCMYSLIMTEARLPSIQYFTKRASDQQKSNGDAEPSVADQKIIRIKCLNGHISN